MLPVCGRAAEVSEVKVYIPDYYSKFVCIADKCRHSCCVGWEITVDSDSMKKYIAYSTEYPIIESIEYNGSEYCFRLDNDERCPHLDESGLCRIILNMGEGYLCDICREHPRFYSRVGDRIEAGLGMVCEAAAELILTSDTLAPLREAAEERAEDSVLVPAVDGAAILSARAEITDIISDKGRSLEYKLRRISEKFSIPGDIHTPEEWISIFKELEILDTGWQELLDNAMPDAPISAEAEQYLERLLQYLIYRHLSGSDSYENMRARIGFSILGVRLVNAVLAGIGRWDLSTVIEVARMYSSEIEYSEENTAELIFEFESAI